MSQQVNLGGQQPQVNLNVNAQQGPQGPRADLPQELRNAQLATRHYPSFLRGVANFFLSVGHTIMEGVRSIANFFSTSPTPPPGST